MDRINTSDLYKSLQAGLNELEATRIGISRHFRRRAMQMIPLMVLFVVGWFYGVVIDEEWVIYVCTGAFALCFVPVGLARFQPMDRLGLAFKKTLIAPMIKTIDDSFVYSGDTSLNDLLPKEDLRHHLHESKLFDPFDQTLPGDFVAGKFGEDTFELREVKLNYAKFERVMFHGIVVRIFSRNLISSPVYLLADSAQGETRIWNTLNLKSGANSEYRTGSFSFDSLFRVYSDEVASPKKLLTEGAIERILSAYERLSAVVGVADAVNIYFAENRILLAVSLGKSIFEPTMEQSINQPEYFERKVLILFLILEFAENLADVEQVE